MKRHERSSYVRVDHARNGQGERPIVTMHCMRAGEGRPLLLLHGLGGSWRSWCSLLPLLRPQRDVIAVDLPGFGDTPPLEGSTSLATLADAVTDFLGEHALIGVDVAGVCVGATLALELAERGVVGAVVALSPVCFRHAWQRTYFVRSAALRMFLARKLESAMPRICHSRTLKATLFAQISPNAGMLPAGAMIDEMQDYVRARRFHTLLRSLPSTCRMSGELSSSATTIVWGRQDRLCPPGQAKHVHAMLPKAHLSWFDACGHYPQWDQPKQTAALILRATDWADTDGNVLGGRTRK